MGLSFVQLLFLLLGTFQALPSEIEQCYVPNPSHPCSPETIGTDCINQGGESNCLFQGTCLVEDHQVFITIDNDVVLNYENGTQGYVDFSLGAVSVNVSNPLGLSGFFLIADGATVMSNTNEDITSCNETKVYNDINVHNESNYILYVNDGVEHIKLAFIGYGEKDEMYGILIDLYSDSETTVGCPAEGPQIPEYGYHDECTDFFFGDICIARCNEGYHGGSRCYECNGDGEWEICVGTQGLNCIPVDCGTLIIDSIVRDCPSTTYEGDDCDVQLPCDSGTQLVSYKCDWDGVWKQTTTASNCGHPSVPTTSQAPTITPTSVPTHSQHSIAMEYTDSSAPTQSPCVIFFIVYLLLTLV